MCQFVLIRTALFTKRNKDVLLECIIYDGGIKPSYFRYEFESGPYLGE